MQGCTAHPLHRHQSYTTWTGYKLMHSSTSGMHSRKTQACSKPLQKEYET